MTDSDPKTSGLRSVSHVKVGEDFAGVRLDRFLLKFYPEVPKSRLFRIVRKGEVRVNGKRAQPEQRLALDDDVRLPPLRSAGEIATSAASLAAATQGEPDVAVEPAAPATAAGKSSATAPTVVRLAVVVAPGRLRPGRQRPARVGLGGPRVPDELIARINATILLEDERLLVINKPAGIAVHGGSGMSFGVIEALRAARPHEADKLELVHRLDRDTSGVLLVARKPAVLRMLHAELREGDAFDKRYLTLLRGSWQLGKKRIDAPLRTDLRVGGERTVKVAPSGKSAASDFAPVEFYGPLATLMQVTILTGRTHQIRVHATHAGHPVAGDEKYGDADFNEQLRKLGLRRMFLHAASLSFTWPDRGTEFSANAPLPDDLKQVIDAVSTAASLRNRARRWRSRSGAGR